MSPESAGSGLQIFLLEEALSVLTDYCKTKQAAVDLWNQLGHLWQEQHPDNTELPSALQSHRHRGAEKGNGSAQDRARRLHPVQQSPTSPLDLQALSGARALPQDKFLLQ